MKPQKLFSVLAVLALATSWLGAETTEPKKLTGDMPEYSDFARTHELSGTVVVEALVDENGRVFAADVVDGVHVELDLAAVNAVSSWTFEPATEDGKPVMKVVRIPIQFNLIDPLKESLRSHDTAIAANK